MMKNMFKKSFAFLLAALIVFAAAPMFGLSEAEAAVAEDNYKVTTEFYCYDETSGKWIVAGDTANAGDEVKMRVSVETGFTSGTAELLLAYDKSVLSAPNVSSTSSSYFTLNTSSSFVQNSINFVIGANGKNNAANQVGEGNITQAQFSQYGFISCNIYTRGCVVYDGSDWIFEVDMTVLRGTKDKTMECFIIPSTVCTMSNTKGCIKFPKAPKGSTSSSSLVSPWNWYEGTPELASQQLTVVDIIEGEVFPDGYNYETDSLSFPNFSGTAPKEVYNQSFSDTKAEILYKMFGDKEFDMSYGMAALTGLILCDNVPVSDYENCETISDITKDTVCTGYPIALTAKDDIAGYTITRITAEIEYGNCADIYDAVYDFVYNNGAPVIINIRDYSYNEETGEWILGADHSVLAVGLSGNNGIIVDDSEKTELGTIVFETDENGKFTNEWSYGAAGGDNTFDASAGKAGVIGYNLWDFESLNESENLICISPSDAEITGAYGSSDSNVYWSESDATVTVSDVKTDGTEFAAASENASVSTTLDSGEKASASISDSKSEIELSVEEGKKCSVDFGMVDSNGEIVTITVSGTAVSETVTITRDGNNIIVDGLETITASIEKDNTVTESNIESEEGKPATIIIDAENTEISSTVFKVKWVVDNAETTEKYKVGAEIINPADPEKEGYTFAGWTPSIPDSMPAEDLTFNAQWTANSYNASFDANGGKWADGSDKKDVATNFDSEITAPETPEKLGYLFSGWSADGETVCSDLGIMDSVDGKSFVALWVASDDILYTVETYKMNTLGEYEKTVQNFTGTTEETVSVTPEIGEGFKLNSEKSVLSGTVAGDSSLVLSVYIDRETYSLTTIIDGAETKVNYLYGAAVSQPAAPSKQGYTFAGWDNSIPQTMPANNITVTAVFRIATTIQIKNNPGSKTINYGETLKLTAVTANLPEGAYVKWFVEGSGVKMSQSESGDICRVESTGNGTVTVTAKVVDKNGNPLSNGSGEISDSQKVVSKAGLWQKIVSFFKNLFRSNREIVQIFKGIF